jgi:uncharacterized protein YaaQ
MTKEELLPLAKTYFDSDPNRTIIFGTEDKHFYNTIGDVKNYCKSEKEYFTFTKDDFKEKVKVTKPKEVKSNTEKSVKKITKKE